MSATRSRTGAITGGRSRTGESSRTSESSRTTVPSREEGWCCITSYMH